MAYVYNGNIPQSTLDWQRDLYNELIKLTGLKGNRSNGIPRANFHECREPCCDAVLLELGFMDSITDVPIILTQDFAYKCAQACVNVIIKKAGLTKNTTIAPTVPTGTYKLVKDIPSYATAGDAKAKTNVKGTYKAGTYYIFSKYPTGFNGMFNLTNDKTGKEAGAWINPNDNVITATEDKNIQKIYRVRKTWADDKSQKGAYSSLDNAKVTCQETGSGYNVFDWNGKIVYTYVTPKATPTPAPTPTPSPVVEEVYELNFPSKHQIVEYDLVVTEGINEEQCTRAIVAIKNNNPNFDIEIAKAFFLFADEYHIDPMRAISQSILETGWFKFAGSDAKVEQHNYCGLDVTGGGVSGASFDTVESGVRAQLQHLYAYGCKGALPDDENTIIDPRFKYVTRGIATYWEQLAGRWAIPGFDGDSAEESMNNGTTYGQKINKIYEVLIATKVTSSDIEKYFAEKVVETKVESEIHYTPAESSDKGNSKNSDTKINSIVEIIIKIFKELAGIFSNNFKN